MPGMRHSGPLLVIKSIDPVFRHTCPQLMAKLIAEFRSEQAEDLACWGTAPEDPFLE